MFYYISKQISESAMDLPGIGVFNYLTVRAVMAIIVALIITITFGNRIIARLKKNQIGESIRDLGLEGQMQKSGTPTMGGLLIILAIILPTLLFAQLGNVYIILMLITTVWLASIGFVDDYIKVILKNKDGLSGHVKIIGQVGLGLIVGFAMWYSPDIVVRENPTQQIEMSIDGDYTESISSPMNQKSSKTTIPFIKENEFDYGALTGDNDLLTLIIYVIVATFVVTAVSNGANLTDGLDGLAAGVSAPVVAVLGLLAYLSGNIIHAEYLNIMYIPGSGELVIFAAAMTGALIGFMWYNTHPAQVFMGDTGSLAIGGIIAVFALCIRKELMLPLLCGVFLVESLSVMIQVGGFKLTRWLYGDGRRVFLMAPFHHHLQRKGQPETKIVVRFWIISIMLAVLTILTLKIR